jgi:hypothetical protein
VDINWRPVFWPDAEAARPVILEFLELADLVKISDADLEYLYGQDPQAALQDPCSVRWPDCLTVGLADCTLHAVRLSGCAKRPGFSVWRLDDVWQPLAVLGRLGAGRPRSFGACPPNRTCSRHNACSCPHPTIPRPHPNLPHPQVAHKLPAALGVLVTAGDEGAAYCFRSSKGEHSGFVKVYKVCPSLVHTHQPAWQL